MWLGEVAGEGDGDGSGAGADVDDLQRLVCGQEFQDGFDEVLGLGARDEDGRGDVEGEAVELLLAGDVLDGFVVQAAGDVVFVAALLAGGEFAVWVGESVARGICRVWRRRSSASRVAVARRCGSLASCAAAR